MILSGLQIKNSLNNNIHIHPFDERKLNPNSYNLSLYHELLTYDNDVLDMKHNNSTQKMIIPEEGLELQPNKLYLGRTVEYTETFNLIPMLEGRSSVGRLGLFVHITAGFGDVGFQGYWTLEIVAVQPIRIYPNVPICQIFYHTIEGDFTEYKSSKYQKNQGIQASMMYKDFESSSLPS